MKALDTKSDDISSTLGPTWWKTPSLRGYPLTAIGMLSHACTYVYIHVHTTNKCNFNFKKFKHNIQTKNLVFLSLNCTQMIKYMVNCKTAKKKNLRLL